MRAHLVVNPASGNGRTGRHFDRIARLVRDAVGEFDCSFTRRYGDAAALAREAARSGADLVVAVGGDGTASDVVDGLVAEAGSSRAHPAFAFIPSGTGGDLARSLGCASDPAEAARALAEGARHPLDVGRIEFLDHQGRPRLRHFVNVAGAGIAGLVDQHVERMGKMLGGRLAFALGAGRALLGWRDQRVRWRADGGPWREEPLTALSVCNGRFFGGGMMVAPDARVADGVFDVTLWGGLTLYDFVARRRMLYQGTHVRLANTRTLRARVVEAEPCDGARVLLDVDGEQPGILPARFTIVPAALEACAKTLGAASRSLPAATR